MKLPVVPVIMAGGSGTRLWPLSRAGFPKQFLVISGNSSLFQQAVARLQDLAEPGIDIGGTLVVGNEEHRFLVLDQLRDGALSVADRRIVITNRSSDREDPPCDLPSNRRLESSR